MKRTIAEALQTATKVKQEIPSLQNPEVWMYDMVKIADGFNILYQALQTIADPDAELPKSIMRNALGGALAEYYEELSKETLSVVNGKYERK